MTKYQLVKEDFLQALSRLKEVLIESKSDIVRDSAIQRFEFTLDLAWKTVKAFLEEYRGIQCLSPKGCFKEAFTNNLIEHDVFWLELVDLRNDTVHTYKQELAESTYQKLPKATQYFDQLLEGLKKNESE